MTPRIPAVLTTADLPVAELASARLDGELFGLAGSWCPIDALDAPATRAGAIEPAAPRRAVAERMTAAWIYGLAPEPAEHQFCVDVSARIGNPPRTGVRLREVRIAADDIVLLGRLSVTSPLRTAVDLARWGVGRNQTGGAPHGTAADVTLLAGLLAYAGLGEGDDDPLTKTGRLLASRRGVSFSRIAQARLQEAFALLSHHTTPETAVRSA
jgi:hypothetical protein